MAELVITGSNLGGTTAVSLGEIAATLVSVSSTEVRASVEVPHGTAPGPRTLTVATASESASLADAIEITPFVVSATAPPGGLGTFESPMTLCDENLHLSISSGDTVLLLAGEHVCSSWVEFNAYGITIEGQGIGATVMTGVTIYLAGGSLLRDLTLVASEIVVAEGTVERVAAVDSGGIVGAGSGSQVVVSDFSYEGGVGSAIRGYPGDSFDVSGLEFTGTGIAIELRSSSLVLSDSTITGCDTGIYAFASNVTVAGTTFDGCQVGIRTEGDYDWSQVDVRDSDFVDNRTSISNAAPGGLTISDSTIRDDPATPAACERGVMQGNKGLFTVNGVTITGQTLSGIEARDLRALDIYLAVVLTDVVIEGGQYGVYMWGGDEGGLYMRSSIVGDQTIAAVSFAFSRGWADLEGDNQLSVVSGYALEDMRPSANPGYPFLAAGIRLNGILVPPQFVRGPISVPPDYRIDDNDGSIQFGPDTGLSKF